VSLLLLLVSLPSLYWPGGVESAPALRKAGIEHVCVPPQEAEAWRGAGFAVTACAPADLAAREKLPAPGIAARAELASATRSPWVFANGWRFLRHGSGKYAYDLPARHAALAAAEAFAYGADAVLKIDPADLEELGGMLTFLRQVPPSDAPAIADIGVVDDGTPLMGEVMNLLVRRNLLFRVVETPQTQFRINVELGTKEYPRKDAADPSAFALQIRRELGDEQRVVRVYGSEVVICRPQGDGARMRVHLLNYGGREVDGLRLRLRGSYAEGMAFVAGLDPAPLQDYATSEETTEFSLARMAAYAVVDLKAGK